LLGTFECDARGNEYVYLDDVTKDSPASPPVLTKLAFDKVTFKYLGLSTPTQAKKFIDHTFGDCDFQECVEDPVGMSTGNYLYKQVDVTIPGHAGMTMEWKRKYNSRRDRTGVFGRGWSTIADMALQEY